MSRIISGRARGRRLASPAGPATRPTAIRVRQVLFDILAPLVPGCRFLDVFAGSGGVGLEALSRGAARVVLVERDVRALGALRENVRRMAEPGGTVVVQRQDAQVALAALAERGERFDVIYLDPPYESNAYEPLLALLGESGILAEDGLVVAEHFHKRPVPERMDQLVRAREVRVGDHKLSFYRRGGSGSATSER